LSLGVSSFLGDLNASFQFLDGTPVTADINDLHTIYYSAEYLYNKFTFAAELLQLHAEPTSQYPLTPQDLDPTGWYVQGAYRMNNYLELHYTYNEFYNSESDRDGANLELLNLPAHLAWQKFHALGLRYDINTHWIVKVEWQRMNGLGLIYTNNPNEIFSFPPDFTKDWNLYALKATFNF